MIEINNLGKTYGKLPVLQQISIQFQQGQSVAIIGPNGSGKTTLIKCILGMVLPSTGSISVEGLPVQRTFNYRRYLGYMSQIAHYPPNLTVKQLFSMMLDIRESDKTQLDEELVETYALPTMYDKKLGTLSGGMKQKVSAALAFLFNPTVLILDEPTVGLDPLASEVLKEKIKKEAAKGKLILITSHIIADLEELCNRVAYLQEGKLLFFRDLQELRAEHREEKLNKIIASVMQQTADKVL